MASVSVDEETTARVTVDHKDKPHLTSLAVWDVPFSVSINAQFRIKVGVQCSAACNLAGSAVEIRDHSGASVASGALGDAPWSVTGALYWTEFELVAPVVEGPYNWTAHFKAGGELSHPEASHPFAFAVVRAPQHVVTVEVVDKSQGTRIKNAQVILHPFSAFTDENGIANIGVSEGDYQLWIPRIAKYAAFRTPVQVRGNIQVKAELELLPPPEP